MRGTSWRPSHSLTKQPWVPWVNDDEFFFSFHSRRSHVMKVRRRKKRNSICVSISLICRRRVKPIFEFCCSNCFPFGWEEEGCRKMMMTVVSLCVVLISLRSLMMTTVTGRKSKTYIAPALQTTSCQSWFKRNLSPPAWYSCIRKTFCSLQHKANKCQTQNSCEFLFFISRKDLFARGSPVQGVMRAIINLACQKNALLVCQSSLGL